MWAVAQLIQLFYNRPSRVDVPEDSPVGVGDNHKDRRKSAVKFRIATWNVRTMLKQVPNLDAVHTSSRSRHTPPGRAALISRELDRLAVDVAALSETRLLDKGELEKGGYHFLYSGNPLGEERQYGVAIAIRSNLRASVQHWHAVNVTARINLRKRRSRMVISAYAPTLTSPDESK